MISANQQPPHPFLKPRIPPPDAPPVLPHRHGLLQPVLPWASTHPLRTQAAGQGNPQEPPDPHCPHCGFCIFFPNVNRIYHFILPSLPPPSCSLHILHTTDLRVMPLLTLPLHSGTRHNLQPLPAFPLPVHTAPGCHLSSSLPSLLLTPKALIPFCSVSPSSPRETLFPPNPPRPGSPRFPLTVLPASLPLWNLSGFLFNIYHPINYNHCEHRTYICLLPLHF